MNNHKVCIWKRGSKFLFWYKTSCGQDCEIVDFGIGKHGYKYCPYCGKKIKEIPNE